MKRIQANLIQFYPIEKLAHETYAQLTLELLAHDITTRLAGTPGSDGVPAETAADANSFYELLGEPNSVEFTASQCSIQGEVVELSGEVVVIEYDTDSRQSLHTLTCAKATLHLEGDKLAPILTMDLHSPRQAESGQLKMRHVIQGLLPPQAVQTVANEFKTEGGTPRTERLASKISELSGLQPSRSLVGLQSRLQRKIRKTFAEIKAEIHSRLVFGTGCVPMILIGIGLGILKRGGHLLSAFGASCVPAAVLIVCIMSGKQMTENLNAQTVSGVALMWTGLGFLSLLVVVIYSQLLRR
jgi:hypothetical protein